jgi:SAM-dependent methyltransferase
MSAEQGFRISWAGETSASGNFANVIHITETICTPFAVRQFQLLGLLPPVDTHPRVLDNACGSGRQAEVLQQAYADAGKAIDITCCDISPGMISSVERRIKEGNWGNVKAHVVNAEV